MDGMTVSFTLKHGSISGSTKFPFLLQRRASLQSKTHRLTAFLSTHHNSTKSTSCLSISWVCRKSFVSASSISISIEIAHLRLSRQTTPQAPPSFDIILVTESIPTSIRSTCRGIYDEALPILRKRQRSFRGAKVFPKFILLLDTGCGGATKKGDVDVTSLREFIETWPIGDNNNLPLNPRGLKKYLVVCSHCHYDHIRSSCIIFSRTVINILPSGGRTFREGFTDLPIIARQRVSQTRALGNVLTL